LVHSMIQRSLKTAMQRMRSIWMKEIKSVQVLLPVNILAHGINMQGRIILISK